MPKIVTFNGANFWQNAYAHQRGKLLKLVKVPDDQLSQLVRKRYSELPISLKLDIETSGVNKKDLL